MNQSNIRYAIRKMVEAEEYNALHMCNWQQSSLSMGSEPSGRLARTLPELHRCGNKACFAGTLAISKRWRETGGQLSSISAVPGFSKPDGELLSGASAIAYFLGIDTNLANRLIYGTGGRCLSPSDYSDFYGCTWNDVTPRMVIAKLEAILSGELK